MRYLWLSLVGVCIGYFLARQCEGVHTFLLSSLPLLKDKNTLFISLMLVTGPLLIIENKYFWGHFIRLKTPCDIWGVAIGFQIGFFTLSIY